MQTSKNLSGRRKAMIFSAGLGTRLKPITNHKPKALAEINEIPLLEIVIRRLIDFGYLYIVINIHHFSEQILEFLKRNDNFGINIKISDESDLLLDTGGGLQKAKDFLLGETPVLLHNVDVLTNLDYHKMELYHLQQHALVTLAVRNRESSRYLLLDEKNRLCGWNNVKTKEKILPVPCKNPKYVAFSGIHFINPQIFAYLNENGPYSIIQKYLELAPFHMIKGYIHDEDFWMDLGKPENINDASKYLNDYFPEL